MTPFLTSLVPLGHQNSESLLGQPCSPQSSVPLHVFMSGEVHNRMGTLPFETWAVFVHTEERILIGRRDFPFSVLAKQRHFKGLGLSLALFPLPVLLSFPSFQISALVFLDATSHPLRPFS